MSRPAPRERRFAQGEHPWERTRRLQFERWAAEVRRTPYGRPVPGAIGFVQPVDLPPSWSVLSTGRRLFAFSALPTGVEPSFLASVPTRRRPPPDGALVRLSHPVKRVLPVPDSARGELVLDGRGGILPASWDDIVEGIPPRDAKTVVPRLAEILRVPHATVESILLPLVGTIPWHGRREGLGVFLEVEGWTRERHRHLLSQFLDLVPQWVGPGRRSQLDRARGIELSSGAILRRASPSSALPFAVQLRPIAAPAPAAPRDGGPPTSVLRFGRAVAHEFAAELLAGHAPVLLSAEEVVRVPRSEVELPTTIRAAVWGLHWWTPEPPDTPDWHRWMGDESPRLATVLERMPPVPAVGPIRRWPELLDQRDFRDALAQWAYARARLRGAAEVEQADLARTIDAYSTALGRATEWSAAGRGPLSRAVDRSEAGRTSRFRRVLEGLFDERPDGYTLEEARAALRSLGTPVSAVELEHHVERLRVGGILYQDRTGRYRAVGG